MKSAKMIILLGLVYLLALLAMAPAQIFTQLMAAQSDNRVYFSEVKGTIWKGRAHIQLPINNSLTAVDAGEIVWQMHPLPMLAGQISLTMALNGSTPFQLTLSPSHLHLEHVALTLPGKLLQQLIPKLQALELGGNITINAENMSIFESEVRGKLNIDWSEVSSPISPINPLGNYHLSLSGSGTSVNINLHTATGSALIMEGSGIAGIRQGLHFEGSARAHAAQKQHLEPILRLIGNELQAGSGSYKIKI